jgi:hypothetical protein
MPAVPVQAPSPGGARRCVRALVFLFNIIQPAGWRVGLRRRPGSSLMSTGHSCWARPWLSSIMQLTILSPCSTRAFGHALLGRPVPRGRWRVVVDAGRPRRFPWSQPLRQVPGAARDLPQRAEPATSRPGRGRCSPEDSVQPPSPRHDYRLTSKGRDLWPVLTAMRQWGDRYAAPGGPPLELVHYECGHVCGAVMTCSACGKPIGPEDVQAVPGPGAPEPLVATAQSPGRHD